MDITEIRVSDCVPFEDYPFQIGTMREMEMLKDSIRESGILMPVAVRPKKNSMKSFRDTEGYTPASSLGLKPYRTGQGTEP